MTDPNDLPVLTDEDAIRLSAALAPVVDSEAWGILCTILRGRETALGRAGLRDETKVREYYVGRMDEALHVVKWVETVIAYATDARAKLEAEKQVLVRPRLGGGSLS